MGLTAVPLADFGDCFIKAFIEFVVEGMYRYVRGGENDGGDTATTLANPVDFELLDGATDGAVDLLKFNLPARLLIVLANVLYLRQSGLGRLTTLLMEAAPSSTNSDSLGQIHTALSNVEQAVMQLFLQGQVTRVIHPIEASWLQNQFPWNSTNVDIRKWGLVCCLQNHSLSLSLYLGYALSTSVYKALLALSDVQSLICDVSLTTLRPLLRDLTHSLLSALLQTAKLHVEQLGPAGLIQAKIDLDYVQQRLAPLITPEAAEILAKTGQLLDVEFDERRIAGAALRVALDQFYADHSISYKNLFLSFQLS